MRTFRVMATMTTYLYADVEAEDEDKALEIARGMDGSDFSDRLSDDKHDWNVEVIEEMIDDEV